MPRSRFRNLICLEAVQTSSTPGNLDRRIADVFYAQKFVQKSVQKSNLLRGFPGVSYVSQTTQPSSTSCLQSRRFICPEDGPAVFSTLHTAQMFSTPRNWSRSLICLEAAQTSFTLVRPSRRLPLEGGPDAFYTYKTIQTTLIPSPLCPEISYA